MRQHGRVASTSARLIGRDAELAQLRARLGGGQPTTGVLLGGDAGVGKSRLLGALARELEEAGWLVVTGHCLDFGESALAYLPFSEVIGRLQGAEPDLVERVCEQHPPLTRLLPGRRLRAGRSEAGAPLDPLDPVDPGGLVAGVHALLDAVADRQPLLVVVEDAHWADGSTRDLVGFCLSRRFEAPVRLVVSYRSDDLHRRHALRPRVAEWSRWPGVHRTQLAPLPEAEVRALVAELADDLDEAAVRRVVDRSEGNAFFVEELVAAEAPAGPRRGDGELPEDLADLLLVRLDGLEEAARSVVRQVSVAGRRVSHDLLVAATELPEAEVERGLRQAVEAHVLEAGAGAYAFRHALLAEAVYDDLLPGERVRLHARFAAALTGGVVGTAAELARHARRALDLDTALTASVEAGEEALAVGGPEEAAGHLEQALELLADPGRLARSGVDAALVAVRASQALAAAGHPQRAATLLGEQLDRLPADAPSGWRARLASAHAEALMIVESDVDVVALSRRAVELTPEGETALRAAVLAGHARVLAAHDVDEEARAVGHEALALAERLGLPTLASEVLTTLGGLERTGPPEALGSAMAEAVRRAAEAGAVPAELRAHYLWGRGHAERGEWPQARACFLAAVRRGEQAGTPWAPYALEARWQLSLLHHLTGEWDEVLALTEAALDPGAPEVPAAMVLPVRLLVLQERGHDVTTAARALRGTWEREGVVAIHASEVLMRAAALAGDHDDVLAVHDDALEVLSRLWHPGFGARVRLAAVALGGLARLLDRAPAAERPALLRRAGDLHRDAAAVAGRAGSGHAPWGPEGRYWAVRLEAEHARLRWVSGAEPPSPQVLAGLWGDVVRAAEELGHVPEATSARAVLATCLRQLGDVSPAESLVAAAREAARALGAVHLVAELRAGRGPGGRGGVVDTEGGEQLTPREHEILGLVAEGLSNGEIGRRLVISTKTVSVHVSRVLAKLGAAGRTEAAAIARRRGLVD